ncbi:MAG TPA: CHAT domain-containing tetratricopeptide repeat protein [Chloroflexota bacterium]|jgi:CHAT domain-containing protein
MDRAELAERLATAEEAERSALLAQHADVADVALARALKAFYDDHKTSQPARAVGAAAAARRLSAMLEDPEVEALAAWTEGMVALQVDGQMERALTLLDRAAARFEALGQPHTVAATQVSRLHALAMLGRYDEAIAAGLAARDTFVSQGDRVAVGKIENNLGMICVRREQYGEAERFFRAAREHYAAAADEKLLAQAENNLGIVLKEQYRFRAAREVFEQALERAERAGLEVTETEIRYNLGCLALFQGRYDSALDYLEQARRRYASLGMRHRSARAEQELADAYLELNLAPEAAEISVRVAGTFAELGMRAERARALACQGYASVVLGRLAEARNQLGEAHALYLAEGNLVGAAFVTLVEAQLEYAQGHYDAAAAAAMEAEGPFSQAGAWGRLLLARWLRGDAARAQGRPEAREILDDTLRDADAQVLPQLAQRCHTSLGKLAAAEGDRAEAERSFERAVEVIEQLRAPLPAEEFRTAFFADKLTPYLELVRLSLEKGGAAQRDRAFEYLERARSRALADMLAGTLEVRPKPRDAFEAGLQAQLDGLREELSWFYSQINRVESEGARGPEALEGLRAELRERERRVLELTRQLHQRAGSTPGVSDDIALGQLQRELGADTALVEYFALDGVLQAFVVTQEGVEVAADLGREEAVEAAVRQLQFQLGALRFGTRNLQPHLEQLTLRARRHLGTLYDLLLRPLQEWIGDRRLVVVPHRALHYVPFHALHDGAEYVVERREVVYAPSASILRHCLTRARRPLRRAVLVGVDDPRTPRVRDEVEAISPLFPDPVVLLDGKATLASLREHAPTADVLHLACHGQFRPDNPLFSSLRLADGWLTVHDAYGLDMECGLVTLSACETGLSVVAPGDELLGLARGFLSRQTPSLVVSLWMVDDESTAEMMGRFYAWLRQGQGPAGALRQAQREMLERHPHPFFWSPFLLLGRW